jgi:hypothetical protein
MHGNILKCADDLWQGSYTEGSSLDSGRASQSECNVGSGRKWRDGVVPFQLMVSSDVCCVGPSATVATFQTC